MTVRGAKSVTVPPAGKACLWIFTAAGPRIGFGHLRRCIILAEKMSGFADPLFLLGSPNPDSRRLLRSGGYRFLAGAAGRAWKSLALPSAILLDTRICRGPERLISAARKRGVPLVSIHDLGLNPMPSDVVIDGSILPGPATYGGTRYMVLDPAYRDLNQKPRKLGKTIRSVFVNLGGGYSTKLLPAVLEGLKLWGRPIRVSAPRGFASWGRKRLRSRDWRPLRFRWELRGPHAALSGADLAITAGGLSAYEALCAGTPTLALSCDSWQQKTVSALARAGACVNLGPGGELDSKSLAALVGQLDRDRVLRRTLSRRGRKTVDGRGAERVSGIIRNLIRA